MVAAACGVAVCKHGNRKASSTSGSTDVLEELGIGVELDGPGVARCVGEVGVGFAFARAFHPAMRHAGPVRAQLGIPSVFNLLGPLSNPAGVQRTVLGVADGTRAQLMAETLARREMTHALVVSGSDGLDELTLTGPTTVFEVVGGSVERSEVSPGDVGLTRVDGAELAGGDPAVNADLVRRIFGGETGPRRDLVVLNAAAGLVVAGVAQDLSSGVAQAGEAIETGAVASVLDKLVLVSGEAAAAG